MTYADKPLDENPLWNAAYHLRFAYEYMVTARVLDTARQSSSHYERMARKSLEEAAEALGLTLVKAEKVEANDAPARVTVVTLPYAKVTQ